MAWYFFPMTLQYLAGGAIALAVTILVYTRNPKTTVSRLFLSFGLLTTIWMFCVFAARNAPSEAIAHLLYRIIIFCFNVGFPLLLLTLLSIRKFHKINFLTIVPGVVWGGIVALVPLFTVAWSRMGWSYAIVPAGARFGYPVVIAYFLGVVVTGLVLARQSPSKAIARKYYYIVSGCVLYFIPLMITNNLMWKFPWIIPIGGLLLTVEFLFFAYAVSLPADTITVDETTGDLAAAYARFMNQVQIGMPGQDLGDSNFKFGDYIEAMGLGGCIVDGAARLSFARERMAMDIIRDAPQSVIRLMEIETWMVAAVPEFREILTATGDTLNSRSSADSRLWREQMLRSHGGFLLKHELLATLMPPQQQADIFRRLKPGQAELLEEETPAGVYQLLRVAQTHSIRGFCVTKLTPQDVTGRYGIENPDLLLVGAEPDQPTGSPADSPQGRKSREPVLARVGFNESAAILKRITAFAQHPTGALVVVDCIDQMKLAVGFARAVALLQSIKASVFENNASLMISLPPAAFEASEREILDREFRI